MVRKIPGVDYEADLANVRAGYVTLTPAQRMKIIGDRIADDPYNGPNKLVTMVSAVEGFARALVVQNNTVASDRMHKRYGKFRFCGPDFLVEKSLRLHRKSGASAYFEEDTWALFLLAVEFRNLVVHDATYLGGDKFPELIRACVEVLSALATLAGVPEKKIAETLAATLANR
jgi:hypothetical protein